MQHFGSKSIGYLTQEVIKQIAGGLGLYCLGFRSLNLHPLDLMDDKANLISWQKAGYNGDMAYMQKPADQLSSIHTLIKDAKAYFFVKTYYSAGNIKERPHGYGRVARYAWGKDYHKVLKKKLTALIEELKLATGLNFNARIFSDAVPLLERAHAREAGIGFIGKNSMLIEFGKGSFSLLAGVVLDIDIETDEDKSTFSQKLLKSRSEKACGTCTKCITNCPTSAIVKDYTVSAGRCISYLTIEKRGRLDHHELESIGEWIFGCDICQEVCPYNTKSIDSNKQADLVEFSEKYGVGEFLSLKEILMIKSEEEYIKKFNSTPLMRTKRRGLIRNAIAVSINTGFLEAKDCIVDLFKSDADPVVRETALWGLAKLSSKYGEIPPDVVKRFCHGAFKDPDAELAQEARRLYETI